MWLLFRFRPQQECTSSSNAVPDQVPSQESGLRELLLLAPIAMGFHVPHVLHAEQEVLQLRRALGRGARFLMEFLRRGLFGLP